MPFYHPVPEKLLTQIGDITVSFAALELYMQELFLHLVQQTPRIAHIITSQLTFSRLRATLISLYKEKYGEDGEFTALKDLMIRAARIEEERNLITHSIWGGGDTNDSILRIKVTAREKRGLHAEFKRYDETMFRNFVASIQKLTEDIFQFDLNVVQKKP